MPSPQEYRNRISQLGIDGWSESVTNIDEAKAALSRAIESKNSLWEMRKGIKKDVNRVWQEYKKASQNSSGNSLGKAVFTGIFGKRALYKIQAQERSQLNNERDKWLLAYDDVQSIIDDLLNQLGRHKKSLQKYIGDLEREKKHKSKTRQNSSFSRKHSGRVPRLDYYEYIKSQEWKEKAEEAKARAGNRCQVCNRSRAEVQLDAHHRTYERLGNERPEDITVLCRECHQLYEDQKKAERTLVEKGKQKDVEQILAEPQPGYCIRCGGEIALNPQAPYCYSCYKVWQKYENPTFQEKFCHICGKENESTMLKPACWSCYQENRDKF